MAQQKFKVTPLLEGAEDAKAVAKSLIESITRFRKAVVKFEKSGTWTGEDAKQWFGVTYRFIANSYVRTAKYTKQWGLCLSAAQDNLNKQKTYKGQHDARLKSYYNGLKSVTEEAMRKAKEIENGSALHE